MAIPDLQTQTVNHTRHERNPGLPLDLGWINAQRVNLSATERRAATLGTRRSVKKDWQAAWLLRAVTCIDLTTLSGDDTPGNVQRLCAKARQPVRQDLLDALGVGGLGSRWARSASITPVSPMLSRRSQARLFRWRQSRPAFRRG